MTVEERVYRRMPESMQPLARRFYYVVRPGLSWRQWKKRHRTTDAFVEQFFDSEEEYEAYEEEFFEGRIRPICEEALAAVDGDKRIYDAHQDECAKLYALIRKRRPETVVETGVYSGVSTAATLLALDRNDAGTLHSLDPGLGSDPEAEVPGTEATHFERGRPSCSEAESHELPEGKAPGWMLPEDLQDRWHLTVGRSRRELPALLDEAGDVDLFFHDSEHSTTGMLFEFELAWPSLTPGGVVLSPHVGRNDAFETFAAERECTHGLASFEPPWYLGSPAKYDESCSFGYVVKE